MKTILATLLISIVSLQLFAQEVQNQNERSIIDLPEFNGIEVGHTFKVLITQGNECRVEIETDKENLNKVDFKIEENILSISNDGITNPDNLIIHATVKELKFLSTSSASFVKSLNILEGTELLIEASGASEINLELDYQSLKTESSGAAVITLKGAVENHTVELSGASQLKAPYLESKTTKIDASGASQANVVATENIEQNTSGMAQVNGEEEVSDTDIEAIEESISEESEIEVIEDGDRTKVKIGELDIEIIDGEDTEIYVGDSKMKIDSDGNIDVKKKKKKRKYNGHFAGIDLGYNGMLFNSNQDPNFAGFEGEMELVPHKSIQVNLNIIEKNFNLIANRVGLTTGIGLTWNNYVFEQKDLLISNQNDLMTFIAPDATTKYQKSKIDMFGATIPLMLEFQTNNKNKSNSFHISAGAQFGMNFIAKTDNEYQVENRRAEVEDENNIDNLINPYRVDAIARIGWGKLNLFGSYSLNTLFRDKRGPEVVPFTVGITIWNW